MEASPWEALFSGEQGFFEFPTVAVSLSSRQASAGINLGLVLVGIAVGANGVVVFKAKAQWVDVTMAGGALAVLGVGAELLAQGPGPTRIDGQGGHIGRRVGVPQAQYVLENPDPSQDRGGLYSVGGAGEDRSLGDEAAAAKVGQADPVSYTHLRAHET